MIEKLTAYRASDGHIFHSIDLVQRHEIILLFETMDKIEAANSVKEAVAECLVSNRDKVLDILTTTARSKPKARAINGGKKSRKPAGHPTHVQIQTNPPTIEKL